MNRQLKVALYMRLSKEDEDIMEKGNSAEERHSIGEWHSMEECHSMEEQQQYPDTAYPAPQFCGRTFQGQ